MTYNPIQRPTGLVKAPRPQAPRHAVETCPDTDRYKFGYIIAGSTGRHYKISFDAAPGAMYWTCSCRGCISTGQCKHLTAAGLRGRQYGKQLDFAKKHGFIS
jgi:hypothetical protein